jgi:heme/copper-type cytochrome/quinol oxidase subunit 4
MSTENIEQQVKAHQKIYVALIVLTLVSAGSVMAGMSAGATIILVLVVAAVQGLLIVFNLMHLKQEQSAMKGLMALCAFFIVFLLVTTSIAFRDTIAGTNKLEQPAAQSDHEEGH